MKKITASIYSRVKKCGMSLKYEDDKYSAMRPGVFADAAFLGKTLHGIADGFLTATGATKTGGSIEEADISTSLELTEVVKRSSPAFFASVQAISFYIQAVQETIKQRYVSGVPYVFIEKKLRVTYKDFDLVMKADCLIITEEGPGKIHVDIFDFKTGNYDYSETGFDQLYFSFLVYAFSQLLGFFGSVSYTGHIVQPNYWKDAERWKKDEHFFSLGTDYPGLFNSVLTPIITGNNCHTYSPGEHCILCPGFMVCAHVQDSLDRVLFAAALPETEILSKEAIVYLITKKRQVMKFFEGLDTIVISRMEGGEDFPGLTLTPKTTKRKAMIKTVTGVSEEVKNIFESLD